MKKYHVKPEFFSLWGEFVDEDTIITQTELENLSREWEKPVDELLDQLEPLDFSANRNTKKMYGVFIDPYEVKDDSSHFITVCDNCYYSFDTPEEALLCAEQLAEDEEPESYLVGNRWTTSKPDSPQDVRGFRMDGWSVGVNPLCPDSEDVDFDSEYFCRCSSLDEMKKLFFPTTWYAVLMDADDQDWGTGSFDRDEALRMAREYREDYPDAYIAVIDVTGPGAVCIDEIHGIGE